MSRLASIIRKRTAQAGLAAVFALAATIDPSSAQKFPSGRSPGNDRDAVTGYLCTTPACDVVRLPNADCICQKQNPGERELSKLRLKCSTREGGAWVACPVKPRYGIAVD